MYIILRKSGQITIVPLYKPSKSITQRSAEKSAESPIDLNKAGN